jgi:hypothetical protein
LPPLIPPAVDDPEAPADDFCEALIAQTETTMAATTTIAMVTKRLFCMIRTSQ